MRHLAAITGIFFWVAAPAGASLIVNSSGLSVSTLAAGLSFPYSMQTMPDGSLLVGVSTPSSGGDYLYSSGGLVNITPGGTETTVFSGLPYPVQSVRKITDNLYAVAQAGTGGTQINFLQPGAGAGDAFTNLGSINFSPSNAGELFNMTLATRPTPGQSGSYDLFFSMNGDTDHTQSTGSATLSGLVSGSLEYNSIAKLTVTPSGSGAPSVSGLQEIANGVRNTAGMLFDASGNLYLDDNGWDIPGTTTPQSADELDFIAASDIGSGIVNFGFPDSYIQYGTGTFEGGTGTAPLAAFQPLNGAPSLGIAEMALAPVNFPTGLNNGLFLSFYGKWEQSGANNTTGPLLYYDFSTGQYTQFIAAGQDGIGHLTSLTSTADALYIGDMNSYGTIRKGPVDGVVYAITVQTPEPAVFGPVLLLLAGLALVKLRLAEPVFFKNGFEPARNPVPPEVV